MGASAQPRRRLPSRQQLGMLGALLALSLAFFACSACRTIRVSDELRLAVYDDAPLRAVLADSVQDGLVDYGVLRRERADDLDLYLDAVARHGPRQAPDVFRSEAHRLAYYLNAYNAIMLRKWLDAGAGSSAAPERREVNKLWFVWNRWRVDGSWVSLHALEQKLIRPTFREPRVHFALVCGALGCPPLQAEPFDPERLDEQLEALGRRWLAEPDGLSVDPDGRVWMSSIFDWYRDDFDELGGLVGVLSRYLADDPRLPAILAAAEQEIGFLPYDWTINDLRLEVDTAAR